MPPVLTLLVATHVAVIQGSLEMDLAALVGSQTLKEFNKLLNCVLHDQM